MKFSRKFPKKPKNFRRASRVGPALPDRGVFPKNDRGFGSKPPCTSLLLTVIVVLPF